MDIVTTVEKHTNPVQPKEQDDQVEFVLIVAGNNYFKIGHKLGLSFVKLRRGGVTKQVRGTTRCVKSDKGDRLSLDTI